MHDPAINYAAAGIIADGAAGDIHNSTKSGKLANAATAVKVNCAIDDIDLPAAVPDAASEFGAAVANGKT